MNKSKIRLIRRIGFNLNLNTKPSRWYLFKTIDIEYILKHYAKEMFL